MYTLQWYRPWECEQYDLNKDEPYIHDKDEETVEALKSILIDFPKDIQSEFEKEGAFFTEISAETVLKYYAYFLRK